MREYHQNHSPVGTAYHRGVQAIGVAVVVLGVVGQLHFGVGVEECASRVVGHRLPHTLSLDWECCKGCGCQSDGLFISQRDDG